MNPRVVHVVRMPSLVLAAALQVLPIVRAALPVTQTAANIIVVLFRWGGGLAAALGGVQAVSGASTVITNPLTARGTNGQSFSLRLTTAPDQAHYWTASGLPPGLTLTGTSGATLWKIEGVPTSSGTYSVGLTAKDVETSGASRTTTATLNMTIVDGAGGAPEIVTQPTSRSVGAGQNTTFTVAASGAPPLTYQWRFNGSAVSGATNAALTITGATALDEGGYRVVVANGSGSVTSVVASLTVTNPPVYPVAGQYNGLFLDTNNVGAGSSGFFNAKVAAAGVFSGSLRLGAPKYPLKGKFDPDGHVSVSIVRSGLASLTVDLTVDGNSLTGRVTDGVWSSLLRADLAEYSAKTNPATALAGQYTVLFPGADEGQGGPVGDGAAAVKVDTGGVVTLAGVLADGTKVVHKAPVALSGDWPLYVPLTKNGGALVGWLRVRPSGDVDLDGVAHWVRPAGLVPKQHADGFVLACAVEGSAFTAMTTEALLPVDTAQLVFSGGDLTGSFTNVLTLGAYGRVTNTSPNKLTFKVNPKTGLMAGVVAEPATGHPIKFQGALLPRQQRGGGSFLGTNATGRVLFAP